MIKGQETIELIIFIVAIAGIVAAISAIACLLFIDFIVHQQLYSYGLRFSSNWANPYWMASKSSYAMLAFVAAVLTVMTYFYRRQWRQVQAKAGLIIDEGLVYRCGGCGKTITKPIKMLDFTKKPIKEVNVCPYCHKTLTESS